MKLVNPLTLHMLKIVAILNELRLFSIKIWFASVLAEITSPTGRAVPDSRRPRLIQKICSDNLLMLSKQQNLKTTKIPPEPHNHLLPSVCTPCQTILTLTWVLSDQFGCPIGLLYVATCHRDRHRRDYKISANFIRLRRRRRQIVSVFTVIYKHT